MHDLFDGSARTHSSHHAALALGDALAQIQNFLDTRGGNEHCAAAVSDDVVNALLDEAGVATVHGSAFGLGPYIRIAYALDDESLKQACQAVQGFCASLSR